MVEPIPLRPDQRHLSSGGDGGTYDGMEARVARLEAGVSHLERDVTELRTDMRDVRDRMARIEERVTQLPGKSFVVAATLGTLAVITALVAFQGQIQHWLGVIPK